MSRTVIIGDIHACLEELHLLLRACDFDPRCDRLISLGDLVHKGPESAGVLEFFIEGGHQALLGNHDDALLQALIHGDLYAEAAACVDRIGRTRLRDWLEARPLYLDEADFLAVHAAFDPGQADFRRSSRKAMLSGRWYDPDSGKVHAKAGDRKGLRPWFQCHPLTEGDRPLFFGHWAGAELRRHGQAICLDTGCCYGGRLSAWILPEQRLVQVSSGRPKQYDY
ncbi:MAG: hypothetical protein RL095_3820 [Verrucomicrobiota bacterium]|jgi:hypothetical protein